MTRIIFRFLAILSCFLPLALNGNAQTEKTKQFNIPFDFVVKKKMLPAGNYVIERLNTNSRQFLVLKNEEEKKQTVLMTINLARKLNDQNSLCFVLQDGKHFLKSLWSNENGELKHLIVNVPIPFSSKNDSTTMSIVKNF